MPLRQFCLQTETATDAANYSALLNSCNLSLVMYWGIAVTFQGSLQITAGTLFKELWWHFCQLYDQRTLAIGHVKLTLVIYHHTWNCLAAV